MQVCMVCMYAIGVHCWQDGVSLRGSNTDGNPFVWVCHVLYYFPIETRETSHRSPICRGVHMYVYACTCMGAYACVCVGGTG